MGPAVPSDEASLWHDAMAWMARYAAHGPDWADAYLVVLCARDKRARVWTYDREFRTTWRKPDGGTDPDGINRGSVFDRPAALYGDPFIAPESMSSMASSSA
jgi:hypothetical protein